MATRIGVADWTVAVGAAAVGVVAATAGGADVLGHVPLVAGGLVLAARRTAPVTVLTATAALAVAAQALDVRVPAIAYVVAVYAAVRAGRRTSTVVVSLGLLAAIPAVVLVSGGADLAEALVRSRGAVEIAWLVAAGAAGEALRQAERRAAEAERTREEAALRRADEERLRIARELHDSLTHQISVIKIQAEASVHIALRRGDDVPAPLLAIRDAAREATRDLRATLDALRDDDAAPPGGVDGLPELVDRFRSTGIDATLTVTTGDLPTGVDRTVYRVVQEALTNVMRHSGASAVAIRVEPRADSVLVVVDDDGSGPTAGATPGVGLTGMRERVAALGGGLLAEPRASGGFGVRVELPVGRTP